MSSNILPKIRPAGTAALFVLLLASTLVGCSSHSMRVFGSPAVLSAKGERVSSALSDLKKWDGRAVMVYGTIVEVDQEDGAWLILADSKTPEETDPEKTIRVVKGSSRILIPANAAGHEAKALGEAKTFTTSTGGLSLEISAISLGIKNPQDLQMISEPAPEN